MPNRVTFFLQNVFVQLYDLLYASFANNKVHSSDGSNNVEILVNWVNLFEIFIVDEFILQESRKDENSPLFSKMSGMLAIFPGGYLME